MNSSTEIYRRWYEGLDGTDRELLSKVQRVADDDYPLQVDGSLSTTTWERAGAYRSADLAGGIAVAWVPTPPTAYYDALRAEYEAGAAQERLAASLRRIAQAADQQAHQAWRESALKDLVRVDFGSHPKALNAHTAQVIYFDGIHYAPLIEHAGWKAYSGSASWVYVSAHLADTWYRTAWNERRSPRLALTILSRALEGPIEGVYGDDLLAWVWAQVGQEALLELARSVDAVDCSYGSDDHDVQTASKWYRIPTRYRVREDDVRVGYGSPQWQAPPRDDLDKRLTGWVQLGDEEHGAWPTDADIASVTKWRFGMRQSSQTVTIDVGPFAVFPFTEGTYVLPVDKTLIVLNGQWYGLADGFDVERGIGVEFLIQSGDTAIWLVCNQASSDLSNWDAKWNNIITTGAGALGLRFDATPERLAFVRSLQTRPAIMQRLVTKYLHSSSLDPNLWSDPINTAPAIPHAVRILWVSLDNGVYVGMAANESEIWVAKTASLTAITSRLNAYLEGHYYFGFKFSPTPDRLRFIRERVPAWVGTMEQGRFVIPRVGGRLVADNAADAARMSIHLDIPLDTVQVTIGATLIHDSGEPQSVTAARLQLWSDGVVTRASLASLAEQRVSALRFAEKEGKPLGDWGRYPHSPEEWGFIPAPPDRLPPTTLSDVASQLILIALNSKEWQQDGAWRVLAGITEIVGEQIIDERGDRSQGWSWQTTIKAVLVVHTNGDRQTLYTAFYSAGGMGAGGDGEGEDYSALFSTEAAACAWIKQYQDQ